MILPATRPEAVTAPWAGRRSASLGFIVAVFLVWTGTTARAEVKHRTTPAGPQDEVQIIGHDMPPLVGTWSVAASGDEVLSLATPPDRPGEVWAGTEGGGLIVYLQNGGFQQFLAPNQLGLSSNRIYDLAFDAQGHAWLATGEGVVQVTRTADPLRPIDTGVWRHFGAEDGLPPGVIRSITVTPDGTIWAGAQAGGAAMLSPSGTRFETFAAVPMDTTESAAPAGPAIGPVVDIVALPYGDVWLAHGRLGRGAQPALSRFDPVKRAWRHVPSVGPAGDSSRGPASDQIMALAATDDGSLWMTTWGRGILRFDGRAWRQFGRPTGTCPSQKGWALAAADTSVWVVCGDDNGRSAGVSTWNGRAWQYQANATLTESAITAIAASSDRVYLGTNGPGDDGGGVVVAKALDEQTTTNVLGVDRVLRTDGSTPSSNDLTAVLSTSAGLFVGTRSSGLLRFDGKQWTHFTRQNTGNGLAGDAITALALRDEELWVGSTKTLFSDGAYLDGGLSAYNLTTNRWRTPLRSTNSDLPDDEVSSLAIGRDGLIWIGTGTATGGVGASATYRGDGLSSFDPSTGKWTPYRTGAGKALAGDTVLGLAADKDALWIASAYAERATDLRREGGGVNQLSAASATSGSWSTWRFGSLGFESVFQLGDTREDGEMITGDVRSLAVDDERAFAGTWSVAQGQSVGKWPYVDAVVNRYENGTWHASRWPQTGFASALAIDRGSRLWAGFSRGHGRQEFAPEAGAVPDLPSASPEDPNPPLPAAAVWSGDTWLGPQGLAAGAVTAITADPASAAVWIATENDGLWRFTPLVRGPYKAMLPSVVR